MAQNLAKWDSDGSDSEEVKPNANGYSVEKLLERVVTGTTGKELAATPGSSTTNVDSGDGSTKERKNVAAKKESTLPWCIPSSSTEQYRNMPPVTSEPVAPSTRVLPRTSEPVAPSTRVLPRTSEPVAPSTRVLPRTDIPRMSLDDYDDVGPVYFGRSTLLDTFRQRDKCIDDLEVTNVTVTTISQAEARRRLRESRAVGNGPSESDIRRAFYREEVIKFMEKKNARRERMRNNPESKF